MARIRNRTIRTVTFRTFAGLNLLFAAQGFWALGAASFVAMRNLPPFSVVRYFPHFLIGFAVCNIIFLFGLVASAFYLWEMRHGAVRRSTYLYAAIILYAFLVNVMVALPKPWGSSVNLASPGGNAGLAWMQVSGYPLVALIVLNVVKYYTRRSSAHAVEPARKATPLF